MKTMEVVIKKEPMDEEWSSDTNFSKKWLNLQVIKEKREICVEQSDNNNLTDNFDNDSLDAATNKTITGDSFQVESNDLSYVKIKTEPLSFHENEIQVRQHENVKEECQESSAYVPAKWEANSFRDISLNVNLNNIGTDADDDKNVEEMPSTSPFGFSYSKEQMETNLFDCTVCGKKYKNLKDLRRHENVHTRVKIFQCRKCLKTFTRKYLHKNHEGKCLRGLYVCNSCDEFFSIRCELDEHMKIHLNEKSYECDVCSDSFTNVANLSEHIKSHSNNDVYKCEICNYECVHRTSLYLHWKIHMNEKPHKCHICFKEFTMSSCLDNHLQIHSDSDLYKCESCGKEFKQKYYLNEHILSHEDKREMICEICFKGFNTKSSLYAHKLRLHRSKT